MTTQQGGESTRQIKIGSEIQKEMGELFLHNDLLRFKGTLISVTSVRMTADFALARVNLSVFPFQNAQGVLDIVKKHSSMIRGEIGNKMRNQLRIVPEFKFYIDDTLEYTENIEKLIKL